jgi:hypothetical protein
MGASIRRGSRGTHDDDVRPDDAFTRKQAANFLGMTDTEFALRLIWDSTFPKPVQGAFRAADIVVWMNAQGRKVVLARS